MGPLHLAAATTMQTKTDQSTQVRLSNITTPRTTPPGGTVDHPGG